MKTSYNNTSSLLTYLSSFNAIELLGLIIKLLILVVCVLISVAYFTLVERKILAAIHRRRGPNVVGVYGLLQPLADGFKLLVKEFVTPSGVENKLLFIYSPAFFFVCSLMGWAFIPFGAYSVLVDINIALLFIVGISSLSVLGVIVSGWSSNSKFSFLGALRSASQMISYEITLTLGFVCVCVLATSFNLNEIVESQLKCWHIIGLFPVFLMTLISSVAETNRHPFDLPEAEAELVSGYNTEYSGMFFALFSLAEYSSILLMSSLMVLLFVGGWLSPFSMIFGDSTIFDNIWFGPIWFALKLNIFIAFYVYCRAYLPRFRYDQLMALGWKLFLPAMLSILLGLMFLVYLFPY